MIGDCPCDHDCRLGFWGDNFSEFNGVDDESLLNELPYGIGQWITSRFGEF
jgi:hypothetical protein